MDSLTRRRLLQSSLLSGAALASAPARARKQVVSRRRPNVLWISADDLGCTLGCYGDDRVHSPRIDAFAQEAVLFERAYCQIAVCTASRTSIMTGTRPESTQLWPLEHDWRNALPTHKSIAQHFSSNGYHTHSLGKVFDPRSGHGNAEGWVSMRDVWGIESADKALGQMEALAKLDEDQPWFYAIGFKQPHCPWEPSDEAKKLYPAKNMKLRGTGRRFHNQYLQNCSGANQEIVDDRGAQDVLSRYMGEVSDFDREFGRIYDKAIDLGFLENTIVICWSGDHGYQLSENGLWGKWKNYDASTRVPLLMSYPQMPHAGVRAGGLVETVDMYQTLSNLCGLPAPEGTEGLSFAPLFHAPERSWKKAAFSIWEDQSRSIKTEQHNLIVHDKPIDDPKGEVPSIELYDLNVDPLEENNLAQSEQTLVAQLAEQLKEGPKAALPDAYEPAPSVSFAGSNDDRISQSVSQSVAPTRGGCASCDVGNTRSIPGVGALSAMGLLGLLFLRRRA